MSVRRMGDGFKYQDAEASRKPGYLAKRFAQLRREMKEKPQPPAPNVVRIRKQQGE